MAARGMLLDTQRTIRRPVRPDYAFRVSNSVIAVYPFENVFTVSIFLW